MNNEKEKNNEVANHNLNKKEIDFQKALETKIRELKKLKQENMELQNNYNSMTKQQSIQKLYKSQGGKEATFQDWFNKHSKELVDLSEDVLEEAISLSIETTPWAFDAKTRINETVNDTNKNIDKDTTNRVQGTAYIRK